MNAQRLSKAGITQLLYSSDEEESIVTADTLPSDDQAEQNTVAEDGGTNETAVKKGKRKCNRDEWISVQRKKLRMEGKVYKAQKYNTTTKNYKTIVDIPARSMGALCKKDTCPKRKTCHLIDEEDADEILRGFGLAQMKQYRIPSSGLQSKNR